MRVLAVDVRIDAPWHDDLAGRARELDQAIFVERREPTELDEGVRS